MPIMEVRPPSLASSPESSVKSLFETPKMGKSKIRKLNFDEMDTPPSKSTLSVHKVPDKELPKFVLPKDWPSSASVKARKESEVGPAFYTLKCSPMQVFNSFSKNTSTLAQTLCQNDGRDSASQSKGAAGTKKVCCNCKKSRCLKLYCECFLNKLFCSGCKCANCLNTKEHEEEREKAMQATLVRNPIAFVPKVSVTDPAAPEPAEEAPGQAATTSLRHTRGCRCKKSGCSKKYCECYQIGAHCTALCKCCECHNLPGEECRDRVRGRKGKRHDPNTEEGERGNSNISNSKEKHRPFSVTRIGRLDRGKRVLFGSKKRRRKGYRAALKELICGDTGSRQQGVRQQQQSFIGIN